MKNRLLPVLLAALLIGALAMTLADCFVLVWNWLHPVSEINPTNYHHWMPRR